MAKFFSYFPLTIALILAGGAIFYFLTAETTFFSGGENKGIPPRILPDIPSEVLQGELGEIQGGKVPEDVLGPEVQKPGAKPKPAPIGETVPTEEPLPKETAPKIYTVFMETAGFNPRIVVINAGDTVRWVNNDDTLHWPASDPHPTHTGVPGFDPLADIRPGESFSFRFDEPGIYGYHDHTQAIVSGIATLTGIVRVLAP